MPIRTRLSALFPHVRFPVVSAPMAGAAGGLLASRASKAGAMGFIGSAGADPAFLSKELSIVRTELSQPEGRLPIGTGFLVWKLNEMDRTEAEKNLKATAEQVSCVWLSFGDHLERWMALVEPPCKTAIVVSTTAEAVEVASWDRPPDILVVQSVEAGGHKGTTALPFISFLPEVLAALPQDPARRPAVLAAGGIATGSQIAAALALGADGCVVGTRFLATEESLYSAKQKTRIVQAKGEDTVQTTLFDDLRGTTGWPTAVDGRAISNQTITDSLAGVGSAQLKAAYDAAAKTGDVDRIVTWSGTSVGLVKKLTTAQEVVEELERDTEAAIRRVTAFLP